jgi:hypothetical protein
MGLKKQAGEHIEGCEETSTSQIHVTYVLSIINHPPETDLLSFCTRRPDEGWRHEEAPCFRAHEYNRVNKKFHS